MKNNDESKQLVQRQVAGGGGEMEGGVGQFMDMRPEAVAQRKVQSAANESPQVKQLQAVQEGANAPLQRQEAVAEAPAADDPFTRPLTADEWLVVRGYIMAGKVGEQDLTDNADTNAQLVTEAMFYRRYINNGYRLYNDERHRDVCLIPRIVLADPRVAAFREQLLVRGPIMDWTKVSSDNRMVHIMEQLVNTYGYPVNGAAGIVGNLWAESGTLPNRVEGSRIGTPMNAAGFDGNRQDFTPEQIRDRDRGEQTGPRRPGIGLAQWTSENRRDGLFEHEYNGVVLGADILFSMDAQIDYLVSELQGNYARVNRVISAEGVSLNDATDEVVYRFEVPGSVLNNGQLRPRSDAQVQGVFAERRGFATTALNAYRAVHPVDTTQ